MRTSWRRLNTLIMIAVAAAAVSSCSSAPTDTTPSSTAAPIPAVPANPATTITASNFDFGPPITVAPGATVTFINKDETRHNVTADKDNAFASPTVIKGTTTFTAPAKPGSYPFHCTFHTDMHGTLIVK